MYIEITKEKIKDARRYMDIGTKALLADEIAEWVVQPVEVDKDEYIPIPPLYKENRALKNMLMMGALCRYYLKVDFEYQAINLLENGKKVGEQPIDFYPTIVSYDNMAESNIVNQLERLKKADREISNIIFDMMYDYKCLEQMVNSEIKDRVSIKNDLITRVVKTMELQVSKENIENLTKSIKEIEKELDAREAKVVNNDG